MIAAIVFDFDGVLVDSEPLHLRAYQEVLEPIGLSLPREKYYADYLGYDDVGVFRAVSRDRGYPLDDTRIQTLIEEKSRAFESFVDAGDVFYAGAAACVERLAAAWPLGIASGAARPEIERMLRSQRLDRRFQFIVAAGETPGSKPEPDPYLRAAELHGQPPQACVAIEDSMWGIEAAKAAGMWCIGISHTYPVSELMQADTIVTSLDELTVELIRTVGG